MTLELIQQYIQPQLLIIVPMLWGIGMAVKKSSIKNQYIPLILLCSSCLVTMLHLTSTKIILDYEGVSACLFAGITQGSVIWLVSWIGYEKFLHDNDKE
ncbi:MAG: phage holin family protein, partial [Oscillospiraceae bacterium]